jgi:hypothetical protein
MPALLEVAATHQRQAFGVSALPQNRRLMPPSILRHDHDLLDGKDRARTHLVVPDQCQVDLGPALNVHSLAQDQLQPELASMLPCEHGLDPVAGLDPRFVPKVFPVGDGVVVVGRELVPGRRGDVAYADYRHRCHGENATATTATMASIKNGSPEISA